MLSSISTCRFQVQAKLPSLQLKVNSNYFLSVKYISNLVVIVDRFLSKACVCKDKISALSHIIDGHGSKLKHYCKLPSLQHPLEAVFFVYHLVLKHLLQNVIRSSFCIPKVVRIGAYKGANYSPKSTILVNLGTLLNKVFGHQ